MLMNGTVDRSITVKLAVRFASWVQSANKSAVLVSMYRDWKNEHHATLIFPSGKTTGMKLTFHEWEEQQEVLHGVDKPIAEEDDFIANFL